MKVIKSRDSQEFVITPSIATFSVCNIGYFIKGFYNLDIGDSINY